nr:MAG TPA: major capsid protein [Caudoviricetes sp.]
MPLMTLPEYAKGLEKTDIRRPLIECFAQSSDYFDSLPFENMTGATYEFYRQASLGNTSFRAINEPGVKSRGKLDPYQESSYLIDTDLDVDAGIVRRHGESRRAKEERMQMASVGQLWATTFIKGDNESNPKEFNGLQKRCTAANGRLQVNTGTSGGAPLSLLKLDQAINNTKNANKILAPYSMQPLFIAAARDTSIAGFVIQSWDEIGGVKMSYAGRQILWGYGRDLNTPPLDFNEVAAGGGAASTASIYVANFGEDGVRGIQLMNMEATDKGLLEDHITWRTHVSWDVGLVDEHPFCVTRLTSITNAAFTK